ncbi:Nodulation protein D 2 [Pigmentiphaga humi]|uniref:Nodulation protein D 2 n=1 Tax=Pigmentiphaga humi TaxID=2478468 RepID=A0A3P4AXL0_9BURK|nr:LysR family transcriptional regulator [Pigmentiphaga humi]VCU68809.1 Nodulation protein D 2 [Pigmentiphaga humi]
MQDLNLLRVFEALWHEKSVTLAAQRLGLSQGAVSLSLKRLREEYQDKLFVQVSRTMEPTPLAEKISPNLLQASRLIRESQAMPQRFEPLGSSRIFNIRARDISEIITFPRIFERLQTLAPKMGMRTIYLPTDETFQQLASGRLDLALGYLEGNPADIHRVPIYLKQKYVCVMSPDHPLAQEELTEGQYLDADHLLVENSVTSQHPIERILTAAGRRDRIKIRLTQHLAASWYVLKFDLLWTLPYRLAKLLVQYFPLVIKPVPENLNLSYETCLYWHERFHADVEVKWLRDLIVDTLLEQSTGIHRPLPTDQCLNV